MLAMTMTDAPDPVAVGASLQYSVTARNDGPGPATGVVVTDDLPASMNYVSATASTAVSPASAEPPSDGGGGGCFIATAAYGSPLAREVCVPCGTTTC